MSIEGLLVSLVMVLVLLAIVARPFLQRQTSAGISLNRQKERALLYYERVLMNVRDLDEDHQTGKIAPDEYAQEREFWMARGVQVLQLLDKLEQDESIIGVQNDTHNINDQAIDAHIDAMIEASIDQAMDNVIEEAVANYRAQ
jgi:Ni/Co efflux regulator RcnB